MDRRTVEAPQARRRRITYSAGGNTRMSPSAPAAARLSPRLCPTPGGGAMWNFNTHLARLEEQGRPIRVGLIGSGRFGTMIMA